MLMIACVIWSGAWWLIIDVGEADIVTNKLNIDTLLLKTTVIQNVVVPSILPFFFVRLLDLSKSLCMTYRKRERERSDSVFSILNTLKSVQVPVCHLLHNRPLAVKVFWNCTLISRPSLNKVMFIVLSFPHSSTAAIWLYLCNAVAWENFQLPVLSTYTPLTLKSLQHSHKAAGSRTEHILQNSRSYMYLFCISATTVMAIQGHSGDWLSVSADFSYLMSNNQSKKQKGGRMNSLSNSWVTGFYFTRIC